jgi:DNA processing protein
MPTEYSAIAFAISRVLNISNIKVIERIRSGQDAESIIFEFTSRPEQQTLISHKKRFSTTDVIDIARTELSKIEKLGYQVFSIWDSVYPRRLKEIYDPPLLLYYRGDIHTADEKVVAIVGTRSCTSYGKRITMEISQGLSQAGVVITSGMAQGIDRFAHCGALSSAGKTIAVLGCGIDVVYPRSNCDIYDSIKESGLLLSEYPLGYPPLKQNFPQRNRIISGISDGVIVVEAPLKSGALITAALALDQGRTVVAVPGNITSRKSVGANMLIRSGAPLISSWQEALEEMYGINCLLETDRHRKYEKVKMDDCERDDKVEKITAALASQPLSTEQIASELGMSYSEVVLTIVNMEIRGVVLRRSDLLYELI